MKSRRSRTTARTSGSTFQAHNYLFIDPRTARANGIKDGAWPWVESRWGRSPTSCGWPREVVRAVRWSFLALLFPAPALLLLSAAESAPVLGAAFAAQYAGLLAERWYFFAEANHPQNLYYRAIQ